MGTEWRNHGPVALQALKDAKEQSSGAVIRSLQANVAQLAKECALQPPLLLPAAAAASKHELTCLLEMA